MVRIRYIAISIWLSGLPPLSPSAFAFPLVSTAKIDAVPSICQSCLPAHVKWGGEPHCAPSAIANSLVWLAETGLPALQPFHDDDKKITQAKLVDLLGGYMQTSASIGTTPQMAMVGLKKYLDEKKSLTKQSPRRDGGAYRSLFAMTDPKRRSNGSRKARSARTRFGW